MTSSQGRFVWYELMTTDTKAAKDFYGKVVGWSAQDMPMPGMTYSIFNAGSTGVGGLMTLSEDAKKMGAPPSWIGYVGVDDVDATVNKIKSQGGQVYAGPLDIPEVGRFAVVTDPQQATFALFKAKTPNTAAPAAPDAPGHVGWRELAATDGQKALAFYSGMFGWKKGEAHDMGPMGTYQIFTSAEEQAGGMFTKPPAMPVPFWLYYFNVPDIDAATAKVKSGGGQILNGPMEVPGGSWIVQCKDPQGAAFALVGKRH
jgi:predicted enzyme related to lactoylglutathione lyase